MKFLPIITFILFLNKLIQTKDTCQNNDGSISICEGSTLCCGDLFCCSDGIECIKGECILPVNDDNSSPALLIIILTLIFIILIAAIVISLVIIRKKKIQSMKVSNMPAMDQIRKLPDASNQFEDFQHQKMQDHSILEKSDVGNQMQSDQYTQNNTQFQTTNQNLHFTASNKNSNKKFIIDDKSDIQTENQTMTQGIVTDNNQMIINVSQFNNNNNTTNNDNIDIINDTLNDNQSIQNRELTKVTDKNVDDSRNSIQNGRLDRTQTKTNSKAQVTDGQSNNFSNSNYNSFNMNKVINSDREEDTVNNNQEIFKQISVKDYEDDDINDNQKSNNKISKSSLSSNSFSNNEQDNDDSDSNDL